MEFSDLRPWHAVALVMALGALFFIARLIDRGAPARAVRRAMAGPTVMHVRVRVADAAGASHIAQVRLLVEGRDATKLTRAMPRDLKRLDLYAALLAARVDSAASAALERAGGSMEHLTSDAMRADLASALGEDGATLHEVDIAASLALDEEALALDQWWMSDCRYQGGPYVSDVTLLEFFLDGLAGGNTFSAICHDTEERIHAPTSSVTLARDTKRYRADVVDRQTGAAKTVSLADFRQVALHALTETSPSAHEGAPN